MGDQFFPPASGSEGSSDPGDRQVEWLQSKVSAHRLYRDRQEGRKEGRGQGRVHREEWVEFSPRPHCSSPAGAAIDPKP